MCYERHPFLRPKSGYEIHNDEQRRIRNWHRVAWLIFALVAFFFGRACAAECEAIPVFVPPQKFATIVPLQVQHDDPRYFDVLMVGTIEAVAKHGGIAGFQAWAADLIAWNNQVLSRSAIRSQLRLVNVAAWNHHDSGNATTDLYALSNDADIYALKNLYAADAIQGDVVNAGNVCGTGFIMSNPSSGFPAVSIVADGCAKGNYSSIHEFGHNFGLAHNQADSGSPGCGPCSYGSGTSSEHYCCFMSYVHGQTRVAYASNGGSPKYTAPTGTQITLGYANANAVYTINSITSQTIADWRLSKSGQPTPTPTVTPTPTPLPSTGVTFIPAGPFHAGNSVSVFWPAGSGKTTLFLFKGTDGNQGKFTLAYTKNDGGEPVVIPAVPAGTDYQFVEKADSTGKKRYSEFFGVVQ